MTGREQRRTQARREREGDRAISHGGTMHDRNNAVINATRAVLVDDVVTVVAHTSVGDVVALELAGRVNKSKGRHSALYLFDAAGAAQLAADLVSLAARHGATDPAWAETFRQSFDAQLTAGTTRPEESAP